MKIKATIICLVLLIGLSPLVVSAQDLGSLNYYQLEDGRYVYYDGLVPCGKQVWIGSASLGDYSNLDSVHMACQFCHLFVMLSAVISFLLVQLVPLLAVILLVAAGIMYYLALSNPEKLSRANKMFKGTIIGLIIIYGAWMAVGALLTLVGVADWTGLQDGWYTVNCPIKEIGYTIHASPTLTVKNENWSRGRVISTSPGSQGDLINCGSASPKDRFWKCASFVDKNTAVVLKAEPRDEDSGITWEWDGACSGTGNDCSVSMDKSKLVIIKFDEPAPIPVYTLLINIEGASDGVAGSVKDNHNNVCSYSYSPDGAEKYCEFKYDANTEIELVAEPETGSLFAIWDQDRCSGSREKRCSFTMTRDLVVNAMFILE